MKIPFGSLFVGSPLVPGLLAVLFVLGSCTVIRPGQVGMKQQLGVLSDKTRTQGVVWYFPLSFDLLRPISALNTWPKTCIFFRRV